MKNDIHESVSTLRKARNLIYKQLDKVKEEYNSYRKKVNNTMKKEGSGEITETDGQVATSVAAPGKQHTADSSTYRRKKKTLLRSGQIPRQQQKIQDNPKTKGGNNHNTTDKDSTEKQYKPNGNQSRHKSCENHQK